VSPNEQRQSTEGLFVFILSVDVIALDKLDQTFSTIRENEEMPGVIGVSDIINFLVNVYDPLTDRTGSLHNVSIPLTVDLILNWLLNVYDRYDSLCDRYDSQCSICNADDAQARNRKLAQVSCTSFSY